jgi:hypothetical protein
VLGDLVDGQLLDVLELRLGVLGGDAQGRDDPITGLPVGRGGDGVGVGRLERIDDLEDLVEVPAHGLRVGERQLVVRVDDEHRPHRRRVALAGVDHVVELGDLAVGVGDDRDVESGAADLADVGGPAVVLLYPGG